MPKSTKKAKRRAKTLKPLSLHPLKLEDALRIALQARVGDVRKRLKSEN